MKVHPPTHTQNNALLLTNFEAAFLDNGKEELQSQPQDGSINSGKDRRSTRYFQRLHWLFVCVRYVTVFFPEKTSALKATPPPGGVLSIFACFLQLMSVNIRDRFD